MAGFFSLPVPGARFAHLETSIAEIQAAMEAGRLTAKALTAAYLRRIRTLDETGPELRSVIEINPDALTMAEELDAERGGRGGRGPLHGVPVLLKDNIATGDRMGTTAGSLALVGVKIFRDAYLVERLRQAGAVILGKTNMSEWANIRSSRSTSGWSGRGGLTRNPYALDRNASGSSSGSAAAVASNLAAVAVGTETDGSIVSPASVNGLVGIKPTVGLVSRNGIIPISDTQDTAGPMTRSVADAAVLLAALAGADPHDHATAGSAPVDYTQFLDPERLAGARLGVVRSHFGSHPGVIEVIHAALDALRSGGADLIDPVELDDSDRLHRAEMEVLLHELKAGLPSWLAEFAPSAPISTLSELIAWNQRHAREEMAWFGQDLFEQAEGRGSLTSKVYVKALDTSHVLAQRGIDAVMSQHRLDALVAPTGGPAWMTDLVNGDNEGGNSFSTPAAVAGYPHITVPAGFVHGLPVGLSFVGPAWSESRLIGLAYSFEQAVRARRTPTFPPSVPQGGA